MKTQAQIRPDNEVNCPVRTPHLSSRITRVQISKQRENPHAPRKPRWSQSIAKAKKPKHQHEVWEKTQQTHRCVRGTQREGPQHREVNRPEAQKGHQPAKTQAPQHTPDGTWRPVPGGTHPSPPFPVPSPILETGGTHPIPEPSSFIQSFFPEWVYTLWINF